MSIRDDIGRIGDLVASDGTPDDRAAWSRVRAEIAGLQRRLEAARETLRLTGGEERRPAGIMETHGFEEADDPDRAEDLRAGIGRP